MDDLHTLTLAVSSAPSTSYLSEHQAQQIQGDKALAAQLLKLLSPAQGQALPAPTHPVPIVTDSLLGQWIDTFTKAINQLDFLAWAVAQHFDFSTLRLHHSTLSVTANNRACVFTLADESGWWTLANPIIYISQLLDPLALGMPYLGPKLNTPTLTLPLNLTLGFYGLPMPTHQLSADTLAEELRSLQGFPGFDDSGGSRSRIYTVLQKERSDAAAMPAVLNSTRSFTRLYRYRQLIGVLNDRNSLSRALSKVIADAELEGPEGLDTSISADADALQASVSKAYAQLNRLTDDPAFLAIRTRERIDPASHVLLTHSGHVGARDLDGTWKSLTDAVLAVPHLASLWSDLTQLAEKTGGQLRNNGCITLAQALKLYAFAVPDTLEEARVTLKRLQASLPRFVEPGDYWRAFKPRPVSNAAGSTLAVSDYAKILVATQRFMEGQEGHLFEYLGQAIIAGKTVDEVRAEADFMLVRLLASPLARQLGAAVWKALYPPDVQRTERSKSNHLSALILAALILSVDPQPHTSHTSLYNVDWQGAYFWGESTSFVRNYIEASLTGLANTLRPLAAHLILAEKSPQLLVRGIPDATPNLCSQAWVLFRHFVMYLEKADPGSSRRLTYTQIMSQAYLEPQRSWKKFLDSNDAKWPILEWAVVNGVLAHQERYDAQEVNNAVHALNHQRERLGTAADALADPIVSLRQTALNDLRKVYPHNSRLEDHVLMWLPANSPFSEEGRFEGIHTGPKFSFLDLHMAGALDVSSQRWHSSDPAIKYREMAKQFHRLGQIDKLFPAAFDHKLEQLKTAYRELICAHMSHLNLARREALEYGQIQFFSLSRAGQRRDAPACVGRFGVLMHVSYSGDGHFYECFPTHALIRTRRELDDAQLMSAIDTDTCQPWMRFDWSAYERGTKPTEWSLTPPATALTISKLDSELPPIDERSPPDALGRYVPRTLDSARSHALANIIVAQHLFQGSLALREKARQPISLQDAVSGDAPWADYLRGIAQAPR